MIFIAILAVFIGLFVIATIASGFYIVHTQEEVVVERLGKFHKIASPGLNFKIPWIDTVRERVKMSVRTLNVEVESKTKDNVFVSIPVSVQLEVAEGKVYEAVYKLTNYERQISDYIRDNVRTSLASMTLDTAFESKDDIARSVQDILSDSMSSYGYRINKTLITDIQPDPEVKNAMNKINIAQRNRAAALEQGEADKIKKIKEAEADAESKRLRGEGVAKQRAEVAKGYAEQNRILREAGIEQSPETLMLISQYLDTMSDVASHSRSNVLFMPSNAGGISDIQDQMTRALITSNELEKNTEEA